MKTREKKPNRSKPRVLPDDACPTCGTMMVRKRGSLSYPVHGERISVPSTPHFACPQCGEIVLTMEDARHHAREASKKFAAKHNLLAPDETRRIRESYRMSQSEWASALRVTEKAVARWEAGTSVQSIAMDTVLRMIRDVPGGIDYLRQTAA